MKNPISRKEFLGIVDIVEEAFLIVGYNPDERARVHTLAKLLATCWKKEFPQWDINVLSSKVVALITNGELDRLTASTLIPRIRQKYKAQYPKIQTQDGSVLDRKKQEDDYKREVAQMLKSGSRYPSSIMWRELSLFYLIIQHCEDLIPEKLSKRFRELEAHLKNKTSAREEVKSISHSISGQPRIKRKSQEELEIIEVANTILDELTNNTAEVVTLLLTNSNPTPLQSQLSLPQ